MKNFFARSAATVFVENNRFQYIRLEYLHGSTIEYFGKDTTEELYAMVTQIIRLRTSYAGEHFYLMYGEKPIQRNRRLDDYGMHNYATVKVIFPRCVGGNSIILPTYSVVEECERTLVVELGRQAKFARTSMYTLQSDQALAVVYDQIMLLLRDSKDDIPTQHAWILELAENFFQVVYWFNKCDNYRDYVVCVTLAHKLLTGKSISARFFHVFGLQEEVQGEFTDFVKNLRDLYSTSMGMVGKDSLLQRIRKVYTYLLVEGFLKHFGMSMPHEEFLKLDGKTKSECGDHVSMVFNMFDVALTICERIDAYRLTGDWTALIHSDMVYAKWQKEVERLCALAPFTSNLTPHGTSYFAFISDVNAAIECGDAICNYTRANNGMEGVHMKRRLDSLKMIKNSEITRRSAQKERTAPFGVLVHGSSSVAKSTFTKMLYYYYGKLHSLQTDDHFRYVRNPCEEYWNGFDSSKWCIQLDDIAFLLASKSSEVDPTLKELLNVVNNVPYVPSQAALEDKGKTPVLAKLVLATTNAADLNAQDYFHCPLAVRRRLPLVIKVEPKDEYLASNGKFINPRALPPIEGAFPDYWKITVQRLIPSDYCGRDSATLEDIQTFTDVEEFLKYYGRMSVEHERIQAKSQVCDVAMRDIAVCPLCFGCGSSCACVQGWVQTTFWLYLANVLQNIFGFMAQYLLCTTFLFYTGKFYCTRAAVMWVTRWLDHTLEFRVAGAFNAQRNAAYRVSVRQLLRLGKLVASTYISYKIAKKIIAVTQPNGPPPKSKGEEKPEMQPQGNVYGTVESQLAKEESANVWYNPTLELNTFDVPVSSRSLVGLTAPDIRDMFAAHCVRVNIKGKNSGKTVAAGGIFVRGQWLMVNHHLITKAMDGDFLVTIQTMSLAQGFNSNITFALKRSEINEVPAKDLAFFRVVNFPPVKDITKYWARSFVPITRVVGIKRETGGDVTYNEFFGATYDDHFPVSALDREMPMYMMNGDTETRDGDCGTLGVAHTPQGPIIVGIHIIGYGVCRGYVSVILRDILDNTGDALIVSAGEPPKMDLQGSLALVVPHHRSMFRYIPEGTARIYGSLPGFRAKPKSRVTRTPLQEEMLEHFGCEINFGPPAMTGWAPWKKNVEEMVKPFMDVDAELMKHCVESFAMDIISGLKNEHGDEWKKELLFLSDKAAVNGLPSVKFIDRINVNTSMGHPWNTSKKKFIIADVSEDYPEGVQFTPDVMERVQEIKEAYAEGQRVYPVYTGHLKDEPTRLDKIAAQKTRVFTGAPLPWSLVVRSRLLSFVRLLQKNKFVFEAGPGTVCQSQEWTDVYSYLTKFGLDRIIAGDYGKYDKRMIAMFVLAAFDVIVHIHREAGFDESELRELMCIGYDTAFPIVNVNGDILEFFGTNPSGHPLTVIVNSLVNSLYMRYAYASANPAGRTCADFKQNVNLFTYGDDNCMGVNPSCQWFYHGEIQEQLANIGVEYTMADKTSISRPYIHIKECSFLKRTWRWEDELQAYVCPLEEASIHKSLTMWVPSKTVDPYHQMVSVISSANSEYFFYGREAFEKHHAFFREILKRQPYCVYVTTGTLPGWDALCERFRKASRN